MLLKFCEPETGDPTSACKTCRSHFNWFLEQNLLGKSKVFWIRDITYLLRARNGVSHSSMQNMQVTFQFIFWAKFTGKSKVFWACDAGQFSIDFKLKIYRENQNYIKTRVVTLVLWARTGGSPSSMQNIQVTFYLIFGITVVCVHTIKSSVIWCSYLMIYTYTSFGLV